MGWILEDPELSPTGALSQGIISSGNTFFANLHQPNESPGSREDIFSYRLTQLSEFVHQKWVGNRNIACQTFLLLSSHSENKLWGASG